MPRKSKEINPFDGGINNYANPRDIEDNQSVSLYNLSTLKKGELVPAKNWKITELAGTSNYLNTKICTTKNGFFVYQRDFTTASTPVDGNTTVYLVATNIDSNKSKLFLVNSLTQSAVATEVFEFENTNGTVTILPCYVNADGNIRIGDGSFSTKTHFYGALKKYNLGNVGIYNINETNLISKPSGGSLYTGTMNEATDTTAGTINLNINKVKSYSTDIFNHLSGDAFYDDINASNASPSGIDDGGGSTSASFSIAQRGRKTSVQRRASDGVFESVYLYGPDNPTGSGGGQKFLSVASTGSTASSTIDLEHENASGKFIFTDNSIYIRMWLATTVFDGLSSTAVKIRIGPRVDGDGSGTTSNCYVFTFPSSTFTSAETWTTLECAFGSHTEVEDNGGLNSNNCFELGIEVFDSVNFDENWGLSYAVANITMGTPNEGQWVGKYNFYYNWVFDSTQHSETYKFAGQTSPLEASADILELIPYVKDGSSSGSYLRKVGVSTGSTARITGANIFFSEVDDSGVDVDKDKSHLMELNFDRGARTSLFDEFTKWGSTTYTASGVLAAESEGTSGSSVTLTVDTVNATEALFLNKKIYKSDTTLYGTCTAVNSTTEIVFGGGLVGAIAENDNLYTVTAGTKIGSVLSVKSPSVIDTFSTITGFSEGDKLQSVNFSTGVMLNRRMYVGNVQIYDQSSQSYIYSDRIYKSLPNQPDVFTKDSYVEVAPNDGESITAIATYGDFLLEFKENNMYIINVTQDIEYLEEKYIFAGVKTEAGVCETKHGIVWANRYGLFLFDGKEVKNLLEEQIDRDYWYAQTATTPVIGYNPLEDHVHILLPVSVNFIVYNFNTKGFERYSGLVTTDSADDAIGEDDWTNIITEPDGKLSALFNTGDETDLIRFEATPSGSTDYVYVEMITRDDPLGDPAQFKSLKKCYLTYKINNAQVPAITYRTNGASTDNAFDVAIVNSSNVFTTLELKPNVRSEATNKHSYAIVIKGRSHSSFVINDINLVYREKSLK